MKNPIKIIPTAAVLILALLTSSFKSELSPMENTSASDELYNTLFALDQRLFEAYNTCVMATQAELLAEDIEFYHDQGGLSSSKEEILKGTSK